MALDPGKMRDRIVIQRSIEVIPAPGEGWPSQEWVSWRTLWCRVVYQSGREFRENGLSGAEHRAVFSIRWRNDIDQADRILFGGVIWDIQAVLPVGHRVGVDLHARTTGFPAP